MELLLGAGNDWQKKISWTDVPKDWVELVTCDVDESLQVHVHHDLNNCPWPFRDNYFDEVHAYEVMEHLGQQGDYRAFFNHFYEIWRILKPGGYFAATVPAWDSVWAWGDPGHRRVITRGSLIFLNQEEYKQLGKTAMQDYRGVWKGDFELVGLKDENDMLAFILRARK